MRRSKWANFAVFNFVDEQFLDKDFAHFDLSPSFLAHFDSFLRERKKSNFADRAVIMCSLYDFFQKAKKKKLDKKTVADMGVDISPRFDVLETSDPPVREAGIVVEDVDALVEKLKEQGFVKS